MRLLNILKKKLNPQSVKWQFGLLREKLLGLDFMTIIEVDELGLLPSISNRYAPSGDKFLTHVLQALYITKDDSILDIGCGKGSAMKIMLTFPFKRVDGVEISEAVTAIARRNFKKMRVPVSRCNIFNQNAATFKDLDVYNYFYLYNPFPNVVLRDVMTNLGTSIQRMPRKLTIIYNNPIGHAEIVRENIFRKTGEYPDAWGNQIYIYTSNVG